MSHWCWNPSLVRCLSLAQPASPCCPPPCRSCASFWLLSYMPVPRLQKSLRSRFSGLCLKKTIFLNQRSPQALEGYFLYYKQSLSMSLCAHTCFFSPEIVHLSLFIFIFLGIWLTASVRFDPQLGWLYRFRKPAWLPQVLPSDSFPWGGWKGEGEKLGGERESQWPDIRKGVEVSRELRKVNRRIFHSWAQSLLSSLFLFLIYLKRGHMGNVTWNKIMQSRVYKCYSGYRVEMGLGQGGHLE